MTGYSASLVPERRRLLLEVAAWVVDQFPEQDAHGHLLRCHEVARAVNNVLRAGTVMDGEYGCSVQHSWIALDDGLILDPYCVGRLPIVQLVDTRGLYKHACLLDVTPPNPETDDGFFARHFGKLKWGGLYRENEPRTDIDENVVQALTALGYARLCSPPPRSARQCEFDAWHEARSALGNALPRRTDPMNDDEFYQRILDNVTLFLDQPLTIHEFVGERKTTVGAYLAEVDTCQTQGGFCMVGMQILGGGQTPENPYGRGGITAAEGQFLDQTGGTLRGFMFAGSPTYNEAWATRFHAFVDERVVKERTAFWEKVQAERAGLDLTDFSPAELDAAAATLGIQRKAPQETPSGGPPGLSEGAGLILRGCVERLTAEGEHWVSGDICLELFARGFCTIETVSNPDGSPGGGAYYRITPAGRAYFDQYMAP